MRLFYTKKIRLAFANAWNPSVKKRIFINAKRNIRKTKRSTTDTSTKASDEQFNFFRQATVARGLDAIVDKDREEKSKAINNKEEIIEIDFAPHFANRLLQGLERIRKQHTFEHQVGVARENREIANAHFEASELAAEDTTAPELHQQRIVAEIDVQADGSLDINQLRSLITPPNADNAAERSIVSADAFVNTLTNAYTQFYSQIHQMVQNDLLRDLNDKALLLQAAQNQKQMVKQSTQEQLPLASVHASSSRSYASIQQQHQYEQLQYQQQQQRIESKKNALVDAMKMAFDKLFSFFTSITDAISRTSNNIGSSYENNNNNYNNIYSNINTNNNSSQLFTANTFNRSIPSATAIDVFSSNNTANANLHSNTISSAFGRISAEVDRVSSITTTVTIARVMLQQVWGQSELASRALIQTIAGLVLLF